MRVSCLLYLSLSTLVDAKRPVCELPCQNNGICLAKVTGTGPSTQERAYCQCPVGFAGALCEIKYNVCKGADDKCSNGGQCERAVDGAGKEYFHCDCDLERSDLSFPYAKKICEHASTVFCNADDNKKKKKSDRQSVGGAFCVNGGVCKPQVDGLKDPGCDCPDGFEGAHCQITDKYPKPTSTLDAIMVQRKAPPTMLHRFLVFVGTLIVILATSFLLLLFMIKRRLKRNRPSAQERAKIPQPKSEIEVI